MTTSLYYLLHGNLGASIYYHAMLIPTIFVFLYCVLIKKYLKQVLIVWCICMFTYYIYRMITIFPDFPMAYDKNSIFYHLFSTLGL